MRSQVRCPAAGCSVIFEVSAERLGRNVYCLSCGTRMTARPLEVEQTLEIRARNIAGGTGSCVDRLPLVAILDDIRSLWNVGSIFRTADACGVDTLVLAGITGYPPRPEIRKTALGAEDAVRWNYQRDVVDAIERERERGFSPVVLESSTGATPLGEMVWPDRICLVVGNEVAGVSPRVLEACSAHVAIPMYGVKDSLNVAVAFGIAAHAAAGALVDSSATKGHDS